MRIYAFVRKILNLLRFISKETTLICDWPDDLYEYYKSLFCEKKVSGDILRIYAFVRKILHLIRIYHKSDHTIL